MPLPKPADVEAGLWRGYLNANDDVRHVYEQVFYGQRLTGDVDRPEAATAAPAPASETGLNGEVIGPEKPTVGLNIPTQLEGQIIEGETVHDHAEFYGSVWGNGSASPNQGAPQIESKDLYGPAQESGNGTPQIEAPKIEPPNQGDDMTPGY